MKYFFYTTFLLLPLFAKSQNYHDTTGLPHTKFSRYMQNKQYGPALLLGCPSLPGEAYFGPGYYFISSYDGMHLTVETFVQKGPAKKIANNLFVKAWFENGLCFGAALYNYTDFRSNSVHHAYCAGLSLEALEVFYSYSIPFNYNQNLAYNKPFGAVCIAVRPHVLFYGIKSYKVDLSQYDMYKLKKFQKKKGLYGLY